MPCAYGLPHRPSSYYLICTLHLCLISSFRVIAARDRASLSLSTMTLKAMLKSVQWRILNNVHRLVVFPEFKILPSGAGIVVQQSKLCLSSWHPTAEGLSDSWLLCFCISSLLVYRGKQQSVALWSGALRLCRRQGWRSWLLASAWPGFGCCSHLEMESVDGKSFPVTLSFK